MNKHYPHLFEKGKLGSKVTKNRIVMAPMGDNISSLTLTEDKKPETH